MKSGKGELVNTKVDKKRISSASEHDADGALSSMHQDIPCHSADDIRASCMALYSHYIIDRLDANSSKDPQGYIRWKGSGMQSLPLL